MATATAFNLPVQHEDTMDMSSPAQRGLEDIDIDFDEPPNDYTVDDEHMIEDGDSRPATAPDAEMDDDVNREAIFVQEAEMSDDVDDELERVTVAGDDDLIDYDDDDEYQVEPQVEHDPQQNDLETALHADSIATAVGTEDVKPTAEDTLASPSDEVPRAAEVAPPESEVSEQTSLNVEGAANDNTLAHADNKSHVPSDALIDHTVLTDTALVHAEAIDGAQEGADNSHLSVATNVSRTSDSVATPTDTGIHPISLRYKDVEMPLFKSKHQPEGLLKDDNLVALSLATLMESCRDRLNGQGEDISADKEAILSFDSLPLMIHEVISPDGDDSQAVLTLAQSSKPAFLYTLEQVLTTYLKLHRNDGVVDAPPMHLSLSFQIKFQNGFDMFELMARSGQGMSSLSVAQPDASRNSAEEYHEEVEQEYHEEVEQEYHEDGEQEYHKEGDQESQNDLHENAYNEATESFTGDEQHPQDDEYQPAEYDDQKHEDVPDGTDEQEIVEEPAVNEDFNETYAYDLGEPEFEPEAPLRTSRSRRLRDSGYDSEYDLDEYFDWDEDLIDLYSDETAAPDGHQEPTSDQDPTGYDAGYDADEPADQLLEYEDDLEEDSFARDEEVYHVEDDVFDEQQDDIPIEEGHDEFHTAYDFQAELDGHEQDQELAAHPSATADSAETATAPEDGALNFDDEDHSTADDLIDFDDETTEQHEARKATEAEVSKAKSTNSPLGKRSFEEQANEDDLYFEDEPEQKKPPYDGTA